MSQDRKLICTKEELVPDDLWDLVSSLLPAEHPKGKGSKGGRPRVDDRAALSGIVYVLLTGIGWEYLPKELGFGSGMTCWRRLRDWQEAGVWAELHAVLLDRLAAAGKVDWSRASIDSASVPAPLARKGGHWSLATHKRKQSGQILPTEGSRGPSATLS